MGTTGDEIALAGVARELYTVGRQQLELGQLGKAAFQFKKALAISPGYNDAALALGYSLHQLGQFEEALATYDMLLASASSSFAGWNNRGNTLLELGRFDEAAASYLKALEISETSDASIALATCYQGLGNIEEALALCDKVLAREPGHAEAHWNRSLLLLLKGNYAEGWQEYEWRWKKRNFSSPHRNFQQPLWQGEKAAGKRILIHAEQGFGDTIQFCRYVPLVAEQGLEVIFEVQPPLARLMESLGVKVVAMGQALPEFDLQIPLLSLPLIFGTTLETVPAKTPYLAIPAGAERQQPLDQGLNVGLCWAGKTYPDPRRSCPASLLAPLAEQENICWYSLQVGWEETLPLAMKDYTSQFGDFCDTAGVVSALDLVITIDTAVAHLAGALGKPTWLLLPHSPDWRWLQGREDSPWYPTMKILRQRTPDSWLEVLQRVKSLLRDLQEKKS